MLHAGEDVTIGSVICLIRTVPAHAAEMGEAVPHDLYYFVKPGQCLTHGDAEPSDISGLEHEAELAALIGTELDEATVEECWAGVRGWGVLADLTLRKEQGRMKKHGWPWGTAKAFRHAAPCSGFIEADRETVMGWEITLDLDGEERQRFHVRDYLLDPGRLLSRLSHLVPLRPGDVVALGSGPGVGGLSRGSVVEMRASPGGPEHRFTLR